LRGTEKIIGGLPGGGWVLKGLDRLDLLLSPRDLDYEQHLEAIILAYDDDSKKSLRTLWKTRKPTDIHFGHWTAFDKDQLVQHTDNVMGPVKPELRDLVDRVLTKAGF
jgi:hypothetical protein